MKTLITFLAFAGSLVMGQQNTPVVISPANPPEMLAQLFFRDGGGNLLYVCKAPKRTTSFIWAVTPSLGQATLTGIVVSSNTATATTVGNHGLQVDNLITVGASTTAALNGNYIVATTGSTTTFTFTTSGVPDGTYNTAALTISTTAPLTSQPWWSILKFPNTAGNIDAAKTSTHFSSGSSATPSYDFKCDDRAVTTGTTAIAYQ